MTKGIYKRAGGAELKDRMKQLEALQALPLNKKIEASKIIIRKAAKIADGKPTCVLYSGGKDSTVLLHLVQQILPRPMVMYNNTGMCEPALLAYIRESTRGLDYVETVPDEEAFKMWKRTGYYPLFAKQAFTARKRKCPGLQCSPVQCCYQLKEAPANRQMKARDVQVAFWGNRADESKRRRFLFCDAGAIFKPKKYPWHQCYPLMFWTQENILEFLNEIKPDYPHSISHEAGCWACCTDIISKPNQIQRLFVKDRKRFNYMIRNGFGEQILRAKGLEGEDVERLLETDPAVFLKV